MIEDKVIYMVGITIDDLGSATFDGFLPYFNDNIKAHEFADERDLRVFKVIGNDE